MAVEIALDVVNPVGVLDDLALFGFVELFEPVFGDDICGCDLDQQRWTQDVLSYL